MQPSRTHVRFSRRSKLIAKNGTIRGYARSYYKKGKRASVQALARAFHAKQTQIYNQFWGFAQEPPPPQPEDLSAKQRLKVDLFEIQAKPRKFGIAFTVPDRFAAEISDRARIRGRHPMRIVRVPPGGSMGFLKIVEEAKWGCPEVKTGSKAKWPDPRKRYHRSCLNDWCPQLFYKPWMI